MKYITYILLIGGFFYFMYYLSNQKEKNKLNESLSENTIEVGIEDKDNFLPEAKGEIVKHRYYTISYIDKYEQSEWVAYKLTRDLLKLPNVPRSDWFNEDPYLKSGSAKHRDYSNSGNTRGHLVPSGDMSFDKIAEAETFYMSNMTPQLKVVNNGIWKELEEQTRDWTYQNEEVYIVSGPIFDKQPKFLKNNVAIPTAFYKIILDVKQPKTKAISFIIPHEKSERHLREYAVTIDSLESITNIDFFANFLEKSTMEKLESKIDLSHWPVSEARFKLRVEKWNNQ